MSKEKTEISKKRSVSSGRWLTIALIVLIVAVGLIFVYLKTAEDSRFENYIKKEEELEQQALLEEENRIKESEERGLGGKDGSYGEGLLSGDNSGEDCSFEGNFREVGIIMYHSVSDEAGEYSLTPQRFEEHLKTLKDAGFSFVSFKDIENYVYGRGDLPLKSLAITLDDGYENNFTQVFPILKKYDAPATIYVIGHSVNQDVYTDGKPMEKHFNLATATEMDYSGLVDIQCHTYNMHQIKGRDPEPVRVGVIPLEGESYEEFRDAVTADLENWEKHFYKKIDSLSYPNGYYTEESEKVLTDYGISITLTTESKMNIVGRGDKKSLHLMGRIPVESLDKDDMLRLVNFCIKENKVQINELKSLCIE